MNRRQFLKSAAVATLAAHSNLWRSETAVGLNLKNEQRPRILQLRLLTAVPLQEMKDFYHDLIGLPILEEKSDAITFGGGQTPVTFVNSKPENGEPFYHVAFNIPENKILGAYEWQKPRTPLDRLGDHLRDPRFPDEVVHFRHWNAHSIFFWDPAGNLIEYIARHDLKNGAPRDFTAKDILYASEIAFIADDVTNTALEIRKRLGLEQYRGGDDHFRALGDEHGLLLVIYRGRRWGYNQASARPTSVFPTAAKIRGSRAEKYTVASYPYEIETITTEAFLNE